MKWVKRILLVLIVLIVLGGLGIYFYAGALAEKGIEIGGKTALGVDTEVDSVSIGFFSSSVGINGLRIGNPEGYKTKQLMSLGSCKVSCDLGSMLSDEIQVNEILIDAPEITIEFADFLTRNNLGDLLAKLKSTEPKEPTEPKPVEEEGAPKSFKVDLISITNAKVNFHLAAGKVMPVALPDIKMEDVKNADGSPLMLADIFAQVLSSIGVSAFKNVKGLPSDVMQGFGNTMGSAVNLLGQGAGTVTGLLGDGIKGLGDGLGGGVNAVGEGVENIGKGVGDAIKGIFGGNKEEKKKDE